MTSRRENEALDFGSRIVVGLVLLSALFLRPNTFGESYSVIGFGLICTAAVLASLNAPRGSPYERPTNRGGDLPGAIVFLIALGYLWLVIRYALTDPVAEGLPAIQGLVLTVVSLLALVMICNEPRIRLAVGRGFVLLISVLCASYLVSAIVWAILGIGAGQVFAIFYDQWGVQPVYFPFTPTVNEQAVLGVDLPRFSGIGREPGWMALYCAAAYFLSNTVGLPSKKLKLLLVIGVLGTVSTAGFGVFVVAWAYHTFLRARGDISLVAYLRQLSGFAVMAGALWLAVDAPVLGLAAKKEQNTISLDERRLATEAGARAIFDRPLGGNQTEVQGGINLISDIAVSGLPFVLLITAALLLPFVRSTPLGFGNGAVIVVFLTMLTSQPAKDSTWAFAVVVMAVALGGRDMSTMQQATDPPARTSGLCVGGTLGRAGVHTPIGGRT